MKKIIFLLCFLISDHVLADGAFGTYKGMTKNELEKKGVDLVEVGNNEYISKTAPEPNNNFRLYRYAFKTNTNGLCNIVGFGKSIEVNKKGSQLILHFLDIRNILIKKYGEFRTLNLYKTKKEQDNIMEIASKNKNSSVIMTAHSDGDNNIFIEAHAETVSTGRVDIQYAFDYCGLDTDDKGL